MKLIPLTKGYVAQVDDEDYERIARHNWYASGREGRIYAARRMKDNEKYPRQIIYMHHEVLEIYPQEFPKTYSVDHDDKDRLNNQKYNLIFGTHSNNMQNTERSKKG